MNPNVWANESDIDAPHGIWLTSSDLDNLKHFVQDYTIRSLIPYLERQIMALNDTVRPQNYSNEQWKMKTAHFAGHK